MWIIIRHQNCTKTQNPIRVNGANGQNGISRTNGELSTTIIFPQTHSAITSNGAIDLHEIQTLMVRPNGTKMNGGSTEMIELRTNGGNGALQNGDIHAEVFPPSGHEYSLDSSDEEESDWEEDKNEISQRNLIRSSSKEKQLHVVSDAKIDENAVVGSNKRI